MIRPLASRTTVDIVRARSSAATTTASLPNVRSAILAITPAALPATRATTSLPALAKEHLHGLADQVVDRQPGQRLERRDLQQRSTERQLGRGDRLNDLGREQ